MEIVYFLAFSVCMWCCLGCPFAQLVVFFLLDMVFVVSGETFDI
jgi:hypothetical protein